MGGQRRNGPGQARLRSPEQFKAVYEAGQSLAGTYIVLCFMRTDGPLRVGFSTARGVQGAVLRNRIRRLLRAAWREVGAEAAPGWSVVLIGRPALSGKKVIDVVPELRRLLEKGRLTRTTDH